jgi:MFS family permease
MSKQIQLGLKENWLQFTILVIVNAFVGGMVGLERTIFPKFAELEFGIASKSAILSFIVAFGITKAFTNYFTGKLANKYGRKNLLILGWLIAIPVPLLLLYAPNWNWVVVANVLLGINQGLTWSSTVVMKIDLVGNKDRGMAMGINEFAGYFAVGIVAFFTGYIAQEYGVKPYPFYLGIGIAIIGLILSVLFVKDTRKFVNQEQELNQTESLENVFIETSFKNKNLSAITQAGMVNNLNDGMIWGLLPILLFSLDFDTQKIGFIAAVYPAVWGIGQLFTGKMSDIYSKKKMLFWGMLLQGIAIIAINTTTNFNDLAFIAAILGFGTALVYPTFLAAIAETTTPTQRAESIGVFRLWRDLGYAIGAILSGIIADVFGIEYAIVSIGIITILSSLVIKFRMN